MAVDGRGKALPRNGAHPVGDLLAEIKSALPSGIQLRVVCTLRNQPDFLASLAAEQGITDWSFLPSILEQGDPFLDYASLIGLLTALVGEEQLLILLYEDSLEVNASKLLEFLRVDLEGDKFKLVSQNRRRVESSSWTTRKRGGITTSTLYAHARNWSARIMPAAIRSLAKRAIRGAERLISRRDVVTLAEIDRQRIREHCSGSNAELAEMLGRSIRELGY